MVVWSGTDRPRRSQRSASATAMVASDILSKIVRSRCGRQQCSKRSLRHMPSLQRRTHQVQQDGAPNRQCRTRTIGGSDCRVIGEARSGICGLIFNQITQKVVVQSEGGAGQYLSSICVVEITNISSPSTWIFAPVSTYNESRLELTFGKMRILISRSVNTPPNHFTAFCVSQRNRFSSSFIVDQFRVPSVAIDAVRRFISLS